MKRFLQRSSFIIGFLVFFLGGGFAFSAQAATYTVYLTGDNPGGFNCIPQFCVLRDAINSANLNPGDDIIEFDSTVFSGTQSITLPFGRLNVSGNLTINGTGAERLTIAADHSQTLNPFNVFGNGANLTLNNLTIGNGGISNSGTLTVNNCIINGNDGETGSALGNSGGNVELNNTVISGNSGIGLGAGIRNGSSSSPGTMVLNNCTVSGNSTTFNGGGLYNGGGTLTLNNTTVSGNSANLGGGIYNSNNQTVILNNSTVSGNSAFGTFSGNGGGGGGGIFNFDAGTLQLSNSTITDNSAVNPEGGGGVRNFGTVSARNTIISGNSAPVAPDLDGSLSAQSQNNLVGNFAAVRLAPLGFYGGATLTHALLSGSTAINAGNNCVLNQSCASFNAPSNLTADGRGASRIGQTDIGAFELNNSANGGSYRATLPNGTQNINYNFVITPNNGSLTYSVTEGLLPSGLNLTTNLAPNAVVAVSGTPMQGGIFNFSITVANGVNTNVTDYALQIFAPTSAMVSVGGRILAPNGAGLKNAIVTLTGGTLAQPRISRSSSFGYFSFDDVEAGHTYVITVSNKRYGFAQASQFVTPFENISDIVFQANWEN